MTFSTNDTRGSSASTRIFNIKDFIKVPSCHHISGLHDLCKGIMVFIRDSKTSWASPTSTRASRPSLGSSTSSAGSSTSSAKWWHQNPSVWVQGPCQLGTRCFKAQTHSVRDQGTAGGTWWHQWHPVGPLQVHVGINDNFINKDYLLSRTRERQSLWWESHKPTPRHKINMGSNPT